MKWETFEDYAALSERAAALLLDCIRGDSHTVLGLPTGRTPTGMYERVIQACSRQYHCFRDVTTFNLDEYAGLAPDDPASYATYMRRSLFDHVDIQAGRAHVPRTGEGRDLEAECARYEAAIVAAGGLDLTFLGLGTNGHIGFNEPGTSFASRTRVVELTESTRRANADLFGGREVPRQAVTMGIATILESDRIVLLASGAGKRDAVRRLRSGEVTEEFPASALWQHTDVTVLVDRAAAE